MLTAVLSVFLLGRPLYMYENFTDLSEILDFNRVNRMCYNSQEQKVEFAINMLFMAILLHSNRENGKFNLKLNPWFHN